MAVAQTGMGQGFEGRPVAGEEGLRQGVNRLFDGGNVRTGGLSRDASAAGRALAMSSGQRCERREIGHGFGFPDTGRRIGFVRPAIRDRAQRARRATRPAAANSRDRRHKVGGGGP